MKPDPIFTESGRGFFDTVPRAQDPSPDPPPYDAKAAQKAAEAKIDAWAKRLRLDKLKECQENGDTGYVSLPDGGESDAR